MPTFSPTPFAGRYYLLNRIATGGMAEVFKAKSFGVEGFEKLVVIKRILPHLSRNARFVSMFINEAKLAVSLNHPNIVQVYHLDRTADDYYITMEYVRGRDLMQLLRRARDQKRLVPLPLALFIAAEIAKGLDYAHRRKDAHGQPAPIIHRDISPHNVVISFDGDVKIVDFGIARIASELVDESGHARGGGKYAYMSPEQAAGRRTDARSDIFSLGLVLYELLCGRKAYQARSLAEKRDQVQRADFPPIETVRPDIPDGIRDVVHKTLARDPDDRYASAADLHEDLTDLLFAHGGPVTPQQLGRVLREYFKEELEDERRNSGLGSIVGSLERRENTDAAQPFEIAPGAPVLDAESSEVTGTMPRPPVLTSGFHPSFLVLIELLPTWPSEAEHSLQAHLQSARSLHAMHVRLREEMTSHFGIELVASPTRLVVAWVLQRKGDLERALLSVERALAVIKRANQAEEVEINAILLMHRTTMLVRSESAGHPLYPIDGVLHDLERGLYAAQPGRILVSEALRMACPELQEREGEWVTPPRGAWGDPPRFVSIAAEDIERALSARHSPGHLVLKAWFPRGKELEELAAALSEVNRGRSVVVGLVGDAGIGKSRLVGELGHLVKGRNVGWQVGLCLFGDRDRPLAVFRRLFAAGCRIEAGDPPPVIDKKLEQLRELGVRPFELRFLASLFGPMEGQDGQGGSALGVEDGVFRAVGRVIRGLSADRPMIFVFDNIQWMDRVSMRLLRKLIDLCENFPVLLLVTYRRGFVPDIRDAKSFREIALGPLNRQQVETLIKDHLGVSSIPLALADELYHYSSGNPLHLIQTLRLLKEDGRLVIKDGVLRQDALHARARLPQTVQELIISRLRALSDAGQELLRIIAVAGRTAPRRLLDGLMSRGDLEEALHQVKERELVVVDDESIAFVSHAAWEAAYSIVPPREVRAYHGRVGEMLEIIYADDLGSHAESLFQHFESARKLRKAAKYARMAGNRYRTQDFTARAVDFYRKAMELLRSCPASPDEEDDVLRELACICLITGRLQRILGRSDDARRVLELGLDYADEVQDIETEARLLHELGQLLSDAGGDLTVALSNLEHALELAEAVGAHELSCLIRKTLGSFFLEAGDLTAAGREFQAGLELAKKENEKEALAQLLLGEGTYFFHLGRYEESLECFDKAELLANELGDRMLSGRIQNNRGNTLNFMGRFEEAMEAYRQSGEHFKAVGYLQGAIYNQHNVGDVLFRQNRLSSAYGCFRESLTWAKEIHWPRGEALNLIFMGYIEAVKGVPETGLETLRRGVELARRIEHPEGEATGRLLEGTYLSQVDPDGARNALEAALDIARTIQKSKLVDEINEALRRLDDPDGSASLPALDASSS